MKINRFAAWFVVGAVLSGCGPRVEVARDKIVAAIDRWLGELDVKRKQIDQALTACQGALDVVTREKIRIEVQLEMLDKRAAHSTARREQIDGQLKPLQNDLRGDRGKSGPQGTGDRDVRFDAERLLQERKSLVEQADSFQAARGTLSKAAQTLADRRRILEPRLNQYRLRLEEIDVKLSCVKALQTASAASGSSDATLAAGWRSLETELDHLSTEVETELRFEDAKWSRPEHPLSAGSSTPSVESLLAEIEAIHK